MTNTNIYFPPVEQPEFMYRQRTAEEFQWFPSACLHDDPPTGIKSQPKAHSLQQRQTSGNL